MFQSKSRTNVSIDGTVLNEARRLGINLSGVLEASLQQEIRLRRQQAWREDNRAALDDANEFVRTHGLWSDGLRLF